MKSGSYFLRRLIDFPTQSIVRRGSLLLFFTLPSAVLNFALIYVANLLLDSVSFGIFYFAITIVNVLFAPALILNLFYSRALVTIALEHGETPAIHAIDRLAHLTAYWGLLATIGLVLILLAAAVFIGVQAISIVFLIALILYTSYVADTLRTGLQGLHRFFRLGVYSLLWMVARFVLGAAALYASRSIWLGLVGIAASGPLVFLPFRRSLNALGASPERAPSPRLPSALSMLPLAVSYTVYTALTFVDIGIVYLLLPKAALGVYTASSVLPKGLFLLTMPIVQVAFPVMIGEQKSRDPNVVLLLKGLAATAIVSLSAIVFLILTTRFTCGQGAGIRSCDSGLAVPLLWAVFPLTMIRVLVMAQLAQGRDWHPSWLALPLAVFLLSALSTGISSAHIASKFVILAYGSAVFYGLLCAPLVRVPKLR